MSGGGGSAEEEQTQPVFSPPSCCLEHAPLTGLEGSVLSAWKE